jgi:hypothetical protein
MIDTTEQKLEALVQRVGKVRWWLVMLAILKVAAVSMGFMSIYLIGYALLDHYVHIGVPGRLIAFILFFVGMLYLIIQLGRKLYAHISCSNAANFIESRLNFDQQLVTVIEYHENRSDYPYSRSLATQLVDQVDRSANNVNFISTVPKATIGFLAMAAVLGGILAGIFFHNHYVFFSRYFSRLVHPFSMVNPLPVTTITPITDDLTAESEKIVTPSAKLEGKIPDKIQLILESLREVEPFTKTISITPEINGNNDVQLKTELILPEGKYRYRFKAGDATSPWKTITVAPLPKFTNLTAEISFPGNKKLRPTTQKVDNNTIEVIKGAHIKLTAKTNMPIQSMKIANGENKEVSSSLTADNTVQAQFDVQGEDTLNFQVATTQAVTCKMAPLKIALKTNKPAEFKLLSPEGDYSATNVASIPITFEVNDDCGLASSVIYVEIADKIITASASLEPGAQKAVFGMTLELEDYDLNVGDSIIYYARAEDVAMDDDSKVQSLSTSEIYFIEIAPCRRSWFAPSAGLPNQPKQGLDAKAQAHDGLMDVLEYNRAFIKKTWPLSQKKELSPEDKSRMDSIAYDVNYATEQLALIRNDSRYKFDDLDKAKIDEILNGYNKAGERLKDHTPLTALTSQKQAYQALRKFILDLVRVIPPQGDANLPKGPDRVKIDDQVHVTRYEKEQTEWELKLLSDKLEALHAKENELKKNFDHFLEKVAQADKSNPKVHGEQSWQAQEKTYSQPKKLDSGNQQSSQDKDQDKKFTMEGAIPPSQQQSEQLSQPQQAQAGPKNQQGTGNNKEATRQEQMSLLQARQKDIEKEIEKIKQTMEQLPMPDSSEKTDTFGTAVARRRVREHLEKSIDKMQEFQNKVNQSNYQEEKERDRSLRAASEILDEISKEMADATEALQSQTTQSENEKVSRDARQVAEELAKLAKEYDESVSQEERQHMLNSLEQAKKWLESAQPAQTTNTNQPGQNLDKVQPIVGGRPGNSVNTVYDESLPPAERARLLALKFWSISIQAKKQQGKIIEEDPSDAEFYLLEKQYFENAAKFNVTKEQK